MYVGNMPNRVLCIRTYSVNACVPRCVTHPPRAVNVFLYKIGSSGSSTSRRTTLALRMKPDLQKYGARVFRVFGTFSPLSLAQPLACPVTPFHSFSLFLSLSLPFTLRFCLSCTHTDTRVQMRALSRYLILSRKLAYSRVSSSCTPLYLHPEG